jgi:hypothetical protein
MFGENKESFLVMHPAYTIQFRYRFREFFHLSTKIKERSQLKSLIFENITFDKTLNV